MGAIEWAIDVERDVSVMVLTSLDRLRSRGGDGLLRDVPGWTLARPVFSTLAGLHAQVERRAAVQLVVGTLPGFELVDDAGELRPRDGADAVQGEALLAFGSASGCGSAARGLLASLRDAEAEVVADDALGPASHGRAVCSVPGLELTVSPAWFGGEQHFEGSSCSC